ncbi:SVM family protein ['Opuntia sp.' phytoplasma]|uniref:SVM family protein n=1 Tax=Candidatus Phytoplasma asiaticum TaxID=2763338 RepID=A0AAX3B9X3_9MOLU|nr:MULTISPECIES: SVM family protein [Phytoplasma]MDO8054056.1 SVM family protein ['Opuntia sp.' phytoplasma]MDO8057831.1 SVM family protein ['Opuntia sp.' phytoplasma]UQV27436.1 SVM family protein ['Parthenium hysterophorus' phyllody phytoplasma]
MILVKNKLHFLKLFLVIILGLLLMANNNQVMAIKKQEFISDNKNMNIKLLELSIQQKQLEEEIYYFRNNKNPNLNLADAKEILKLEEKKFKLKEKKSEIYKNISQKTKKVTFNLKPFIKIIETK